MSFSRFIIALQKVLSGIKNIAIMCDNAGHPSRKAPPVASNYSNPALSQIIQGLSELSLREISPPGGASTLRDTRDQFPTSINRPTHGKENVFMSGNAWSPATMSSMSSRVIHNPIPLPNFDGYSRRVARQPEGYGESESGIGLDYTQSSNHQNEYRRCLAEDKLSDFLQLSCPPYMIAKPMVSSHHSNFRSEMQHRSLKTFIQQLLQTKPYIPSTMALTNAGMGFKNPARLPLGSKYQGDVCSLSYLRQEQNLPDHLNTSLWLKGLPPTVQPSQIFDIIQCGAVWSLDLKPTTEEHNTVAATLTFMTPYAAALFLRHYRFYKLDGYLVSASYNKFGVRVITTTESRVLHVEGPSHLMTPEIWQVWFKKACSFRIDRWSYLPCLVPGKIRMEFRFVRVEGQAQSCRQMIQRELMYLGITVSYGVDPCAAIGVGAQIHDYN